MDQIEQVTNICAKINAWYAKWAKQRGISYNMLNIVYAIYKSPDCTQRKICDELLLSKQTVSMVCKELEEKGYLTLKTDPGNKREKKLSFTAAGMEYADGIMQEMFQMEEKIMMEMGGELRTQLVESNGRYCELLGKEVDRA